MKRQQANSQQEATKTRTRMRFGVLGFLGIAKKLLETLVFIRVFLRRPERNLLYTAS